MKLTDYLEPSAAAPFDVEGIDEPLYCKLLGVDDASEVLAMIQAEGVKTLTPFYCLMLSKCVVDPVTLEPRYDRDGWGRFKTKHGKVFQALVKAVQRLNGFLNEEEVAEMGKPSETTSDSASNSSSA